MKQQTAPHLTGFAPYTPVTVSFRTVPPTKPLENMIDISRHLVRPSDDDGFNPYGSGPEPIGRRE